MDEKLALYSRTETEYVRLLRLPLDSRERLGVQSTMALLRDLIADRWGVSAEHVQIVFEGFAADYEVPAGSPEPATANTK